MNIKVLLGMSACFFLIYFFLSYIVFKINFFVTKITYIYIIFLFFFLVPIKYISAYFSKWTFPGKIAFTAREEA